MVQQLNIFPTAGKTIIYLEYTSKNKVAELLILLEGDISEVDLDMSDDEMDLVGDKNQHARPTNTMVPGLDPEMTEVQVEEDDMNDMPLSLCLQMASGEDAD